MNSHKTGFWQLFLLTLLLNFIVQMIHETGHWAVYQAYGRGPVWGFIGLVQLWGTNPLHPAEWVGTSSPDGEQGWLRLASPTNSKLEEIISSAAGPAASLLGAVLGLLLVHRSRDTVIEQIGLALTLTTSFAMTLYYLRSPLRTGGDEYGMAVQLGIAKSVIEIPFAIAFIACLALGLRELNTWKTRLTWLAVILLGGVPTGLALNYADVFVRSQVNEGNPLFLPVIGFSLPVVIVDGLVFLGLWIWWHRMRKSLSLHQQEAG
ncbi:MAG: hypothetical protein HZB19_07840 [Chloroflexi bacterium]|nr:hypothetical protein [Chloroflexota bacterium]